MNSSKPSSLLIATLLLMAPMAQVASDLYLPSLVAIAADFNTNIHTVQFTITLYMAGLSVSQLIYGPMSDGVGRRKPLLFGLTLFLISSLLCMFAVNIQTLLIARLIQGIGAGCGMSLGRAIMRDIFSEALLAKYSSYMGISSVLFIASAPTLGGYIEHYFSWRLGFLLLSLYAATVLMSMIFIATETNQHLHPENLKPKKIKENLKRVLSDKCFLVFTSSSLLTYSGILAWITGGPILLHKVLGLPAVTIGWLYLLSGSMFLVGAIFNGKYVAVFGINLILQLGYLFQLLAGMSMLFFYLMGYINLAVIVGPIMLFMLGSSFVFPNAFAGALRSFHNIAGTAAALFGFLQIVGGVISSSLLAISHDDNQLPIAIALTISATLSCLIFRNRP